MRFRRWHVSAAETDHIFAAEGSESASSSEYDQLDALQARFDSMSASGTEFHSGGGALGVASN
ncbi:hypothetical protein AB0H83_50185 [Dactylosporangium sp. NPDC050688]|uniref:hypothetical protein n=1 Tax=Dactylosporangium sp. NPDC050688 TaxID=3157217 RepID=UPI0033CA0EA7